MSYPTMVDVTGLFEYLGPRRTLKLVAGHLISLLLYVSCALQFPRFNLTADVEEEQYKSIASVLSYVLLTLLVWTVFSFHYYVFGGGIKFASATTWDLRATGLFMVTAPKLHRAMTFFALTVSTLCAFQFMIFDFTMGRFVEKANHYVLYKFFLLKMHAIFCVGMASYSIFRIIYDPKIMRARKSYLAKRRAEKAAGRRSRSRSRSCSQQQPPVSAEGWPAVEKAPQECAICTMRAANRQLRCGHVICCCCIGRIASTKTCVTCPFCRVEVFNTRKLMVEPALTTVPLTHCRCKPEEENARGNEDEAAARGQAERGRGRSRGEEEEMPTVRDGASALLLPMPEITPNMGI